MTWWKKRKINGGGGRQDSTQGVASGIFQINTGVFTFQRLVNRRLVLQEIRLNSGHKTRLHIGQLVKDTSASETDHRTGVNYIRKLQMLSLQRTFKAVLKEKPLMLLSFLHLLVPLGRNEAVIEEREQQGIQEIHNQIGEINEICKDLAKISVLTLTTLELQLLKEDLSSHKPQTHTKIKLISDMLALGDIWHCTPDRGYCSRSLMLEKQEKVFWNVFINEYITWQSLVVGFKDRAQAVCGGEGEDHGYDRSPARLPPYSGFATHRFEFHKSSSSATQRPLFLLDPVRVKSGDQFG
uniref:Uncharacterized protein n=1 Tax=Brassica oleracea var. oleracea TaxID=109376 RepID=A0A0D3E701_BRAOL